MVIMRATAVFLHLRMNNIITTQIITREAILRQGYGNEGIATQPDRNKTLRRA